MLMISRYIQYKKKLLLVLTLLALALVFWF